MNPLSVTLKTLMIQRGLTGAQLGEEIGLSATSVSRILQGHSRPKQVTLSRIMKRLCVTSADEQTVLRAFTGSVVPEAEEGINDDPANSTNERERVERWLEARTQAITFKDAVGRALDKAGVTYRRDVCEGIASADFLVEHAGKRVALECKFNVSRDFEKTIGIARLLRELLRCETVVIVVPFVGSFAESIAPSFGSLQICTVAEVSHALLAAHKPVALSQK